MRGWHRVELMSGVQRWISPAQVLHKLQTRGQNAHLSQVYHLHHTCSQFRTPRFVTMKTPLETSHLETSITQQPHGVQVPEDEPAGGYRVGWRTLMAIVALSMANACAAIANTVRSVTTISSVVLYIVSAGPSIC